MAKKLHKKIVALLHEAFPDLREVLEQTPSGLVTGVVISSAFNRRDHNARLKRLFGVLKKGLSDEEYDNVGAIAALTPAEAEVPA